MPNLRLMSVYQRILGHPFVYDYVRPLAVGGIDMAPSYAQLESGADDIVVDVGCGTGDALRYLTAFHEYHGFDVDSAAIQVARARSHSGFANVCFYDRELTREDLVRVRPTRVTMSGLLHHLPDEAAIELLQMCGNHPTVLRLATQDPVIVPGKLISNTIARLDRGRYVRDAQGYRDLVSRAGLRVITDRVVPCRPRTGLALFLLMALART